MKTDSSNRWLIAVAGVVMQVALGGLCLERLSNSTDEKLRMDSVAGNADVRTRDPDAWFCFVRRRFMDEASGTAPGRCPGWPVLRVGGSSRGQVRGHLGLFWNCTQREVRGLNLWKG